MFSITRTIEESELDGVYRHIHHAKLMLILEEAREAYITHLGLPTPKAKERGILPVVSSIDVMFLREVKVGSYIVSVDLVTVEKKLFTLEQHIVSCETNKRAVDAMVVAAYIDSKTRRAAAVPPELTSVATMP